MYIAVNTPLGMGHNPYFNRWFSAMPIDGSHCLVLSHVTILILIDGFLQFVDGLPIYVFYNKSQSLF